MPPAAPTTALLLVDVQNDFCPGGSLAVPRGHAIVPVIAALRARHARLFAAGVIATTDWHPPGHASFASARGGRPFGPAPGGGTLWPDHCVQGTRGAEVVDGVDLGGVEVVRKGTDVRFDSYSGFCDDGGNETRLEALLRGRGVGTVYVCGIATEVCVRCTALHARERGFEVVVVRDAIAAIDDDASRRAVAAMEARGVRFVHSADIES